jgi:tRNA(Ile)-lysidine synthase
LDTTASGFLEKSGGMICLEEFNSLHPSISSRVISKAYSAVTNGNLEQTHIEAILKLAKANVAHSSVSLPNKLAAKIEHDQLVFVKDEKPTACVDYNQELTKGLNVVANGNFAIFIGDDAPKQELEAERIKYSYFSSACLNVNCYNDLFARNRRAGDLIRNGGMSKKVKKLLCDKKIPADIRDYLPIITNGDEIVYIPNCALADKAKAHSEDKTILITIYKKKDIE